MCAGKRKGFTLIELSVVLVIIGLLIGGVLMGQDLIRSAEVRAQISQIEKYNAAVNAFKNKFMALPGDIPIASANQFGFASDATCDGTNLGKRDGNGSIESLTAGYELNQGFGETALFWQDLTSSIAGNLVEGSYTGITCTFLSAAVPMTGLTQYMPPAKMGRNMVVFVYSNLHLNNDPTNWYALQEVGGLNALGNFPSAGAPIPVLQAYHIDKKMDDGYPTAGIVQAVYLKRSGGGNTYFSAPNANPATASSCYDTSVTPSAYAVTVDGGSHPNCALSFAFQ